MKLKSNSSRNLAHLSWCRSGIALAALCCCGFCLLSASPVCAESEGGVSMGNVTASARPAEAGIKPVYEPNGQGPLAPSSFYGGASTLPVSAMAEPDASRTSAGSLDDYDAEPAASIPDPIESWNRFWFRFNDIFYMHVARPVYKGWTWAVPECFRNGINNFFHNLLFPTRFINNLLQFRFLEAGVEFGRFMMNTMSSAGFANVAADKKTIVPVDPSGEDFGQTLGRWGFGQGFYVVWPFIGPSSLRDTIGRVGDCFTDPIFYVQPWELASGAEIGFRFNALGEVLPSYEDLKSIAVDPYLAMREAYAGIRSAQVKR